MPPKPRITKEMVIDAAFAIARETGAENISARTVAERLNCSTQPVMYHFETIEELKRTVYAKADEYHSEYLLNTRKSHKEGLLAIGLNYILFAIEEPHLFRFLFQSGFAAHSSLLEMMDSDALIPILSAIEDAADSTQAKKIFLTVALFAHGYASLIANYSLTYEEEVVAAHLSHAYKGAVLAAQEKL